MFSLACHQINIEYLSHAIHIYVNPQRRFHEYLILYEILLCIIIKYLSLYSLDANESVI